jgi:broad specificity phosphatase PhoE
MTGQADIPLIEEGVTQARAAAVNMPAGISIIYSSDLLRCKQTTDILNTELQLPVIYDPRLRERDFGSIAGNKWNELSPDGSLKSKDSEQLYDYREFGGEAFEDVRKRIFDFIDDMRVNHRKQIVLVVTSAGIIRMLHHVLNGKIHEIIHNSSFHEFEFPD